MGVELKFTCYYEPEEFITVKSHGKDRVTIWIHEEGKFKNPFTMDIQTAIKLHKTLRTEINKAKLEVGDE